MTLQGIIIRADGVIAETDALERSLLNQVIQSAGFNWTCSRDAFAALRRYPRRRDRYRHFVRQNLGFDRSSEDFERLIEVMATRLPLHQAQPVPTPKAVAARMRLVVRCGLAASDTPK